MALDPFGPPLSNCVSVTILLRTSIYSEKENLEKTFFNQNKGKIKALMTTTMPSPELPTPTTTILPKARHEPLTSHYLQEIELSQECQEIISSLPTEKGWVANYLHQYQGFWHATRQLKGVLVCQKNFQAKEGDVFLVTTPKSGSTWLKALMFALMKRVEFSDLKNHPLLTNNPHALVPFLEMEYIDNEEYNPDAKLSSPRLFSTHLPLVSLPRSVEDSSCKIVYLCRNPKDTFVSFWHFANKLRNKDMGEISIQEAFEKFCRGESLYGPFWDHVLGYWKESLEKPQRIFFLRYEEMKEEPKLQLRRVAEFLGCPFSQEEETNGVVDEILKLCSFDNLSNLEVNKTGKLLSGEANHAFFRRGEVGDSKKYLTAMMLEEMDNITEQKFSAHGLKI